MAIVKGAGAVEVLETAEKAANTESMKFTKLKSGSTLKVRVKGTTDLASYYNYGSYDRGVYSFTPENPSVRNAKGFVESNPTPWDLAAQHYQDLAKKASDKAEEDNLKAEARIYRGELRFMMGFFDLETGEDIVIDFSKNQMTVIRTAILKYAKKIDKIAFEISKSGSGTSTTVSLSPVLDMDEDLTDKERAAFAKAEGQPFNDAIFDGVLYEMDEAEQIESLTKAGFDISLIGLSAQSNGGVTPVGDSGEAPDPTEQF
jgi:hypothetical protein